MNSNLKILKIFYIRDFILDILDFNLIKYISIKMTLELVFDTYYQNH